jgi:hypothetical protein
MFSLDEHHRYQGYGTIEDACYDLVVGVADDRLARTVAERFGVADMLPPRYRIRKYPGTTLIASLAEQLTALRTETQEITPLGLLYFEVGKVAGTGLLRPERRIYVRAMAVSEQAKNMDKGHSGDKRVTVADHACLILASMAVRATNWWGDELYEDAEVDCSNVTRRPAVPATEVPRSFWLSMDANEETTTAKGEQSRHNGGVYADILEGRIADRAAQSGLVLPPPMRLRG